MTEKTKKIIKRLFAHSELVMFFFAILGIFFCNSPFSSMYDEILNFQLPLIGFTLKTFVVDFLLSFFFFSIGLELKKELTIGSLRNIKTATIPVVASFCGAIFPALIYILLLVTTNQNMDLSRCWGIVISTDVAFSLAILEITLKKIASAQRKKAIRTFLLTVAIVDDFIGIVVIALFYSKSISLFYLLEMILIYIVAWIVIHIEPRATFILTAVGVILWGLCYKAGVTPELVGALIAFAIPIYSYKTDKDRERKHKFLIAGIEKPEKLINYFVNFFVLPLFAFCAVQINFKETFSELASSQLTSSLVFILIIPASAVIGKPLGIILSSFVMTKFTKLRLDPGIDIKHLFPVGTVASIGFTVSFLIAEIGFEKDLTHLSLSKMGIFLALIISVLITILGLQIYKKIKNRRQKM